MWEQVLWDELSIKILKQLKSGVKRFTDLVKSGIPRTTLDRRLKQLGSAGLIEFYKDFKTGEKGYKLTPLGAAILKKLEEIEEIYEKYKDTPTVEEAIELVEKKKVKPDKVVKLGREEIL